MRKITSKQKQEKQNRIKQLVVGSILVVIMLISVFGYAFQGNNEDDSKLKYNGFKFVKQNGYWILEDSFTFKYSPKETEEFHIEDYLNTLDNYQDKPLYIYSENNMAESELYKNLYYIVQRIQNACLEGEKLDCEDNLPIKTCEDNFIIIQEGEFKVEQKDNCLFVYGSKEDLIKISDEVLYKIIGVKQ